MTNERYSYLGTDGGQVVPNEQLDVLWQLPYLVKSDRESLEPEYLIERLADDAVYEEQEVLELFVGKEAIADYLRGRFVFIISLSRGSVTQGACCLRWWTSHMPPATHV